MWECEHRTYEAPKVERNLAVKGHCVSDARGPKMEADGGCVLRAQKTWQAPLDSTRTSTGTALTSTLLVALVARPTAHRSVCVSQTRAVA